LTDSFAGGFFVVFLLFLVCVEEQQQ